VSFEGFLNAKLLVEILKKAGPGADRKALRKAAESAGGIDLGIGVPVTFGPRKHQGSDRVYYTAVSGGQFVRLQDWGRWRK
jgi:hypothetical protein